MSPITETLRSYFGSHPEQPLRPILTSLNGDGSWLMSFPLPSVASPQEDGGRRKRFYQIVVDPWLKGPATMISSWLVSIERIEPAAVSDAAGVEALVREIEEHSAAAQGEPFDADADAETPLVDAIFIKVHLLDHLHRPTLETFDKRIPVFATVEAAPTIRGWGHFETVVETRDYKRYDGHKSPADDSPAGLEVSTTADRGSHWKSFHPGKPLPEWLNVFRLVGDWYVELATVLVWSHESHPKHRESGTENEEQHEFIINTPHGVDVNTESVAAFFDDNFMSNSNKTAAGAAQLESFGSLDCLALLAGLKDSYSFGKRETVGVERSLQLERKAEPKYWVKSHDLPLRVGGAVMRIRMTKEVIRTLEYGLEEEAKARLKEGQADGLRKPNFVNVGNGNCFVLH